MLAAATKMSAARAATASTADVMKTYTIPGTSITVSRIAYGCAELASWDDSPLVSDAIDKADRLIKTAYEQGITLFDHADLYAFGKSEQVFGEVLKRSPGLRQKIVIQSKCGQILPPGWNPGQPIAVDLSRKHIVSAVEGSLGHLGTDHLDILLLHLPDPLMEPQEIAQAFEQLKRAGKVRALGVSNFNAAQMARLQQGLKEPLVVNQIHVGLDAIDPIAEGYEFTVGVSQGEGSTGPFCAVAGSGTLDYCQLHDIQVQAWSPLRGELLKAPEDAAPLLKPLVQRLHSLAQARGVTPAAIALAWLMKHPAHIVPVIGATNPTHIIDNCAAERVELTREEWYGLFALAADLKPKLIGRT